MNATRQEVLAAIATMKANSGKYGPTDFDAFDAAERAFENGIKQGNSPIALSEGPNGDRGCGSWARRQWMKVA